MANYALYHNDDFIDVGTIAELADKLKIKRKSLQFYHTPTYRKRTKRGYRFIKLEDIDE